MGLFKYQKSTDNNLFIQKKVTKEKSSVTKNKCNTLERVIKPIPLI